MSRYKIIDHTADIGIEVEGDSLEEIFFQSYKGLYEIAGIKKETTGEKGKFEIKADTLEELLIKFLNELIYYIYVKNKFWEIKKLEIKMNKKLKIIIEGNLGKINKFEREIKAATYHNISIKKENGIFKATIIFDL